MSTRLTLEALTDASLKARGLPELVYRYSAENGIVVIQRGISGYFVPSNLPPHLATKPDPTAAQDWVAARNAAMNVTEAQAEAMFCGSAFGWHLPLADPAVQRTAL